MSATPISWLALEGIKNTDGTALAGGKIFCFVPGTTTQAPVYADAAASEILSQPITLDAYGCVSLFTNGPVKILAQTSAGATVDTIDSFNAQNATEIMVESAAFTGLLPSGTQGAGGKSALSTVLAGAKNSLGGKDFNYLAEAGATERALKTVLRERGLSVKDYGAKGDGSTVDTAAFVAVIASLQAAGGGTMIVPPGTYVVDAALSAAFNGLSIIGSGTSVSNILFTSTSATFLSVTGKSFYAAGFSVTASNKSTGIGISLGYNTAEFSDLTVERISVAGFQSGIKKTGAGLGCKISRCYFSIPYDIVTHPTANGVLIDAGLHVVVDQCYATCPDGTHGAGVYVQGSSSNMSIDRNYFLGLASGVEVDAAYTGAGIRFYENSAPATTTPVKISATNAARFTHGGNTNFVLITDASVLPTVASAADINTLGHEKVLISGTTNITRLAIMPVGTTVQLVFLSNPDVINGTASSATHKIIRLTGAADFTTIVTGSTLTLTYDGTTWNEVGRSV